MSNVKEAITLLVKIIILPVYMAIQILWLMIWLSKERALIKKGDVHEDIKTSLTENS